MSNGEHEIRTPKGLRIGNRSVVDFDEAVKGLEAQLKDLEKAQKFIFIT